MDRESGDSKQRELLSWDKEERCEGKASPSVKVELSVKHVAGCWVAAISESWSQVRGLQRDNWGTLGNDNSQDLELGRYCHTAMTAVDSKWATVTLHVSQGLALSHLASLD